MVAAQIAILWFGNWKSFGVLLHFGYLKRPSLPQTPNRNIAKLPAKQVEVLNTNSTVPIHGTMELMSSVKKKIKPNM